MQERAQPNWEPRENDALRLEVARLKKEINEMKKEMEQKSDLARKVEKLQKENDQNKVIIAYLESEQRRSVSPPVQVESN